MLKILLSEMHKISVSIYLISESEIAQVPTVIAAKALIEGNVMLLFSCELDNDYCDAVLPVEEKSLKNFWRSLLFVSKL
jgi:hypothetical protein